MKIKNIIYNRNRELIRSFICGKSPIGKIVKTIKTEIKKGDLNQKDVENMLDEIYSESVKDFENSKAYPTLFQERSNRFETLKNEINEIL